MHRRQRAVHCRPLVFKSTLSCSVIIFVTFQREGLVKKPIVASLSLLIFLLAACNFPSQSPTIIPTVTVAALPAFTPAIASVSPTPDAVSSLIPEGQPASE